MNPKNRRAITLRKKLGLDKPVEAPKNLEIPELGESKDIEEVITEVKAVQKAATKRISKKKTSKKTTTRRKKTSTKKED